MSETREPYLCMRPRPRRYAVEPQLPFEYRNELAEFEDANFDPKMDDPDFPEPEPQEDDDAERS